MKAKNTHHNLDAVWWTEYNNPCSLTHPSISVL